MSYSNKPTECICRLSDTENMLLVRYGLTDSTNKRAREYCLSPKITPNIPVLFIADGQTEGRGRVGRSFFSPKSTGLYMTLLFRAPENAGSFIRVTPLCAAVCVEAIDSLVGVNTSIKWVNDLYLDGKKVAGILAESFDREGVRYIALGIGINISTENFPDELADKAGSLVGATGNTDTGELAVRISRDILTAVADVEREERYMQIYRRRSCVIGKRIAFGDRQGIARDITTTGELSVELDSGEMVLLSTGEISIISLDDGWK